MGLRALGMVRSVDSLGRIVIPKSVRESLGFMVDTPLEILADEKGVYIRKYATGCTFCQMMEELVPFGGTHICRKCAENILAIK